MQNKKFILKAALCLGISTFALTACETSDWFEDDATYAGEVKPLQQADTTQPVPPPSQEIMSNLPPAAPAEAPQFTSSLPAEVTSTSTTTTATTTTLAPPAPPVAPPTPYTGNLSSVPPRPSVSELPSAQQVASARQDLTADNQQLTNTLKDPNAALPSVAPQPVLVPAQPVQVSQTVTTTAPTAPMIPPTPPAVPAPTPGAGPAYVPALGAQPLPSSQPTQTVTTTTYTTPATEPQPNLVPSPAMAGATASPPVPLATDQNVSGRMLGLQSAGPGKYSLVQLMPDAGIGSFAEAASIVTSSPGNQINIEQYDNLRRVSAEYAQQRGRVRLVTYSNDPKSQEALQRMTTVAAYLIDLGVPASAMRLRIDPIQGDLPPSSSDVRKTDIYLEVPAGK